MYGNKVDKICSHIFYYKPIRIAFSLNCGLNKSLESIDRYPLFVQSNEIENVFSFLSSFVHILFGPVRSGQYAVLHRKTRTKKIYILFALSSCDIDVHMHFFRLFSFILLISEKR